MLKKRFANIICLFLTFLLTIQTVFIFNAKAADNTNTITVSIGPFDDDKMHEKLITIPGLKSIINIKSDNGIVKVKSINGDKVTITVEGGTPKNQIIDTKDIEVGLKIPDSMEKVVIDDTSSMQNKPPFNTEMMVHYPRNENWVYWRLNKERTAYEWGFKRYYEIGIEDEARNVINEFINQKGDYVSPDGYCCKRGDFVRVEIPGYYPRTSMFPRGGYITSTGTEHIPCPYGNPPSTDNGLTGYSYIQYYTYDYTAHIQAPGTKIINKGYCYNVTITYIRSDNHPPECNIIAPSTVTLGDDVYIRGSASDPDGDTLGYEWNIYPGTYINVPVEEEQEDRLKVRFNEIKTYTVELYVTDFKGGSCTDSKDIKVLPPIPVVQIDPTGCLKENRKVTINAEKSYSGSSSCMMDWDKSEWVITPVTEGITSDCIKSASSYNGISKLDVLFKKAGKYKVKCTLYNSLGYSDYKEIEIDIVPDLPPIADFTLTKEVYRNPDDNNYATIGINDNSLSYDGDIIEKRVWIYCFDSDNDGNFDDEAIYVFNNGTWMLTGLRYNEISKLDINNINDGNRTQVDIKTKHVGKYMVELIVREKFGQATIEQFITIDDKKRGNTFE